MSIAPSELENTKLLQPHKMNEATHQTPDTPNDFSAFERPDQHRVQEHRELQEIPVTTLTDPKQQRGMGGVE